MDHKASLVKDTRGKEFQARRDFLKKFSIFTGGACLSLALPSLKATPAGAQIIPRDDPRLHTEYFHYSGSTGEIRSYLARPKEGARLPGILVIHENRGLNPHIEDVTRRLALEGYLACAPDALTPLGGTPADWEKAPALIQRLDPQTTLENYQAAIRFLKNHPNSTGKVGVVGFSWGGAMANRIAASSPDVQAVVPYYGRQPAAEDAARIKAPLLFHYASQDEAINKGIAAYEEALRRASVDFQSYMYEGTQHAFNNDTNPARYNREAALVAWRRTIAFFKEKLR